MNYNKENYSEFIKDERELEFVLGMEEETKRVSQVLATLTKYLEIRKAIGEVKDFSIEGNRFEIETERYFIFILVLHNADVCQYTINKKTNTKANYSRRMYFESIIDTLDKFIR